MSQITLGNRKVQAEEEIRENPSYLFDLGTLMIFEQNQVHHPQMTIWKRKIIHNLKPVTFALAASPAKSYSRTLLRIKPQTDLPEMKQPIARVLHQLKKHPLGFKDAEQVSKAGRYLLLQPDKFLLNARSWLDSQKMVKLAKDLIKQLRKTPAKHSLEEIEEDSKKAYDLMSIKGISLDKKMLEKQSGGAQEKVDDIKSSIKELTGFDLKPHASKDIINYFKSKNISLPLNRNGKPMTDAKTLAQYADDPVVELILKGKKAQYQASTMKSLANSIDDGKVHPNYKFKEELGRVHAEGVNPMNWTPDVKEAVKPTSGKYFVEADYSQMELRVAASMSEDPDMQEAFNSGKDFHTEMAAKIFSIAPDQVSAEQRKRAKTLSIGVLYGKTAWATAEEFGIDEDAAKALMQDFYRAFPKLKQFIKDTQAEAGQFGEVETYFGRKRNLDKLRHFDPAKAQRLGVNHKMQSTAGDLLRIGVINLTKSLPEINGSIITTVHDSILVEVPDSVNKEKVKDIMTKAMVDDNETYFDLKADFKYGENWKNLIPF